MLEEDIDAILERAEVVDNRHEYQGEEEQEGGEPPGAELLSSFNVATFRNEEDDATFWSRLIPATVRPKEEVRPQEAWRGRGRGGGRGRECKCCPDESVAVPCAVPLCCCAVSCTALFRP